MKSQKNTHNKKTTTKRKRKPKVRLERLALVIGVFVLFCASIIGLGSWGIRAIFGSGSSENTAQRENKQPQITNETDTSKIAGPDQKKVTDGQILITATGDVLLEEAILNYFSSGDWKDYIDELKPIFEADNLTIANQEVPIGGEELGIEGINYRFNAPVATAMNLKSSGIDFVSLANNHSMDRGLEGIINTHVNLDEAGIAYTGTWTEEELSDSITYQTVDGVKIGIISYTYDCNQIVDPVWSVNIFGSFWDERAQKLLDQVAAARNDADAVIVCMHWGIEFTYGLSEDQIQLAQALADAGADVIIGNHPHTIQPAEWLQTADGRNVLCFYSLGNLISSAYEVSRADEQFQNMYEVGAIAQFSLEKKDDESVSVLNPKLIPIVNHFENDYSGFKLYKLKDYTEELAARHDQRSYSDLFTVQYLKDQVHSVFDPSGIELELD